MPLRVNMAGVMPIIFASALLMFPQMIFSMEVFGGPNGTHVHVAELYSAINMVYRCPPGPIMSLLSTRSWFSHVGDLYFRYNDQNGE